MALKSLTPGDWLAEVFATTHVAIGVSRLTDGRFIAINDAFLRLFGYTRDEVIGRTSRELGLWPNPAERTWMLRQLWQGVAIEAFEAAFRRHSGEIGTLQISSRIVELDGTQCLVGLLTDITGRTRAEERLKLQADILENLEEGVNLVDARGILRYANPKFESMFGYGPGELIGKPASILNAPGKAAPGETARAILRALQRHGRWRGDLLNCRKDGSQFWTHTNIVAHRHPKMGLVWISIQTDITVLRRAQEQLAEAHRTVGGLLDHLQDEIEEQRRELARDMHDQIGATLTGIRMSLEALAQETGSKRARDIRRIIDRTLQSTRNLYTGLRPPMLDDLGLVETLRWYVRDWSQQSGVRVTIRLGTDIPEPTGPLGIDLFRIVQELLTNVARHAGARRVGVTLARTGAALRLRVRDDGRGFPARHEEGFGLVGIRERLRRHGGSLAIDTAERGTCVTLTIPAGTPAKTTPAGSSRP